MGAQFLAFDLGAESGRAMAGRLRSGVLDLTEVCRFVNEPVREHGSLHWDVLQLWLQMQRALERLGSDPRGLDGIGVDAWGCDYGLLDAGGELLGNPYHYRDARTDGVMDRSSRASRATHLRRHRHPVSDLTPSISSSSKGRARLIDAACAFGTIPDILNFWLTGVLRAKTNATTTQMVDAASATGLIAPRADRRPGCSGR
jgi:rhamnulokinase